MRSGYHCKGREVLAICFDDLSKSLSIIPADIRDAVNAVR